MLSSFKQSSNAGEARDFHGERGKSFCRDSFALFAFALPYRGLDDKPIVIASSLFSPLAFEELLMLQESYAVSFFLIHSFPRVISLAIHRD